MYLPAIAITVVHIYVYNIMFLLLRVNLILRGSVRHFGSRKYYGNSNPEKRFPHIIFRLQASTAVHI